MRGVLGAELTNIRPVEGLGVKWAEGASSRRPDPGQGGAWAGSRRAEGEMLWRHLPGRAGLGWAVLLGCHLLIAEGQHQLSLTCEERASCLKPLGRVGKGRGGGGAGRRK